MKQFKLLHIGTISATALSIASCITSCTSQNEQISFESIRTETLLNKQFARSTNIATAKTFYNTNDVIEFYLEEVSNNHKIYTDDVYLSAQEALNIFLAQKTSESLFTYDGFEGTAQFGIANVSPKSHTLCYGIKIDTTVSIKDLTGVVLKFNLKLNIDAKDIKFAIDKKQLDNNNFACWLYPAYISNWQNPYDNIPRQTIDPWLLSQDHNWSFAYDGDVTIIESTLPEFQANFAVNGLYTWKSVADSTSLYLLESFYSILWHRVDYLKNIIIS